MSAALLQLRHHFVQRKAARRLPRREIDVGLQVPDHESLGRHERKGMLDTPPVVVTGDMLGDLERISPQVDELGETQRYQRILPHIETFGPLLHEHKLPAIIAQRGEISVVRPVEVFLARTWPTSREQFPLIVPVEMDLEGLARRLVAGEKLLL